MPAAAQEKPSVSKPSWASWRQNVAQPAATSLKLYHVALKIYLFIAERSVSPWFSLVGPNLNWIRKIEQISGRESNRNLRIGGFKSVLSSNEYQFFRGAYQIC